eukprot:scaffold305659_cov39-Tisochrysis_lutea.AAC.2
MAEVCNSNTSAIAVHAVGKENLEVSAVPTTGPTCEASGWAQLIRHNSSWKSAHPRLDTCGESKRAHHLP